MFRICFTGHRGDNLNMGGYSWVSPKNLKIMKKLADEILNQIELHKDEEIQFINGMALLTDQIACKMTETLKEKYDNIKVVCAIPYNRMSENWSIQDMRTYTKLKKKADEIVYVDTLEEYQIKGVEVGEYDVRKLEMRNRYMVDNSDLVIAVWDEDRSRKSGTKNCVNYAKRKDKEIIIINPKNC